MQNKNNVIQKILIFAIAVVFVFTAGVFVGKKVQKSANAKEVENVITEEMSVEDFPEVKETLPSEEVKTAVSDNSISDNQAVSENKVPDPQLSVSENEAAMKPKWNDSYQDPSEKLTLEQRGAIRSSYDETMLLNAQDKKVIAESTVDFSNMKIAFLGDSVTAGVEGMTPYPYLLKEALGVKEIYNHGIGGSTITTKSGDGTYSMAERCDQIPKDADIIVVMGGTNDNFYQKEWQYGFLDWESKGDGTFCGGVQLLMKRLHWIYV